MNITFPHEPLPELTLSSNAPANWPGLVLFNRIVVMLWDFIIFRERRPIGKFEKAVNILSGLIKNPIYPR
ncbi:hypothetical protein [Serratia marcescens]|uniref:hypothetical protein n=1 Tax=Serratia marcescens TaxID=615 RepID=UPI002361F13B|nr:hypothetical protein [Serratia marcescens]MDX7538548.1 hypothetical protein [Serratia marcescens]